MKHSASESMKSILRQLDTSHTGQVERNYRWTLDLNIKDYVIILLGDHWEKKSQCLRVGRCFLSHMKHA